MFRPPGLMSQFVTPACLWPGSMGVPNPGFRPIIPGALPQASPSALSFSAVGTPLWSHPRAW